MSDLVRRLRGWDYPQSPCPVSRDGLPLVREAADRIEALEAENEGLREVLKNSERALGASYSQAHAEWQNHPRKEARLDQIIREWREARDAALNQQGNRDEE